MLQLGTRQKLKIVRFVDFGAYLAERIDAKKEEQVLLPRAEISEEMKEGGEINVYLYLDSEDRPVATCADAKIHRNEVALLTVKEVNQNTGAFLDMGLPRDLLLPFAEQTAEVEPGQEVLVAMYVDRSGRLCATMNVYNYLQQNAPYRVGDMVSGRIYETSGNFGYFVAVDDRYSGLIPKKEAQKKFRIGEVCTLRVTQVLADGRLNLSARQKAYQQIDPDADLIREYLQEHGEVPFDDTATPEQIAEIFGISKAAFKRALGRLLRLKEATKANGKILGNK